MSVSELKEIAKRVRLSILRMAHKAQSAHTGGALSCVEILVALYCCVLTHTAKNAKDPKRDRVVFSKAHDVKALYAVLAQLGYFDHSLLEGYEQNDGLLPGHATRQSVCGVEYSAGSLGHGLPMAAGVALAAKIKREKFRVFCILSDGECDEGSTWEAALFAHHHKLDNLVVIVDYNKLQGFGRVSEVLDLEPFAAKWKSFGFLVREVKNGHSFPQLLRAFDSIVSKRQTPAVIIAHTIKGKGGVPEHVGQVSSQYKAPTDEDMKMFLPI
jgi:transketolase